MTNKILLQQVIQELVVDKKEIETPVFGLSMFPFLLPGATVRIKHIRFDDVKVGDIILFEGQQSLVLHRVVRKNNDFIQPKGDSLIRYDRKLHRNDFIGLVTAFKHRGSFISTDSISFILYAKLMVVGQLGLGYFFHPLSIVWYKLFGEKIDK